MLQGGEEGSVGGGVEEGLDGRVAHGGGRVAEDEEDEDEDEARWLWVDPVGSRPGYRDMERFIDSLDDTHLGELLTVAVQLLVALAALLLEHQHLVTLYVSYDGAFYGYVEGRSAYRDGAVVIG